MTESEVEEAALGWFSDLGYTVLHGPSIAPGELLAERAGYERHPRKAPARRPQKAQSRPPR